MPKYNQRHPDWRHTPRRCLRLYQKRPSVQNPIEYQKYTYGRIRRWHTASFCPNNDDDTKK